ncbi:AMP-binding protein [Actinosynnema mirum]|uniref:AMP-dependent synthetase and ligase n=1 Tax=Actinosynnema mirum (strain ATCC 29888 / DSM 43827 / JCM 3225 / NBRC 14064 / NCIMB 13271 / NRRL B-12336 / IMRU 3971 / 101) TaxID=446462 RepID=C6WHE9_ACTMD|nr:AMP-binding protein [Actinosynnema mirum]ACU38068.1 AMP-dependent synthetase and ligase [Actinosynnema mirum DSM 43827]
MPSRAEAAALPPWSTDPADAGGPPPALGDLFAAPALRWPDRPAIADGETGYAFADLERAARSVASALAALGVGEGDRVVVLSRKTSAMPVVAVAVWKLAAVYVPLDGAEPAGRLRALVDRLRPRAVVALDDSDPLTPDARWLGGADLAAALAGDADHPTTPHRPGAAAYVVLAAGPSGVPQGVENSADALTSYFRAHNRVLRVTPDSRVLSLSPFQVDVSFEDTLLPLSLGAHVFQFRGLPAGPLVRAVLARERITHLIAVSLLLGMITGDGRQLDPARLPALELVMTGAQVCDPAVVAAWRRRLPGVRLVHAFGPPEATVFAISHEFGPDDGDGPEGNGPSGNGPSGNGPDEDAGRLIGRPLPGCRVRIVRDGVEQRAPGERGELWVGGERVMLGYVDQPEETARAVVEHDGVRYFRTGDVCSRDERGDLRFHGHADPDVGWLAGRRCHLAEVRRAAEGCPGVGGAVAAVVPRARRDVVALVVTSADPLVLDAVAARLDDLLPDHLRPGLLARSPAPVGADALSRLADAARRSDSDRFALSPDGAVEPIE